MSSIGKLSIRSRLFCLAVLLVTVLIGLTVFLAHKLSTNTLGVEEEAEMVSVLKRTTTATKHFGDLKHWLTDTATSLLKNSHQQLLRAKQRFDSDLQLIEATAPGSAARIKDELERLMVHASRATEAYTSEQRASGNALMVLAREHIAKIDTELQAVVDQLEQRAVARRDSAMQRLRETASISILATILAVIAVAIITALVISSITRPLRRLEKSVGAIIAGRLNFDLPEAGQDEIGKMTKALSMLRDNLLERHRLEELRKSAESVGAIAQRQLRDSIDAISDGLALYDSQDRLVICNAAYREIYGQVGLNVDPGVTYEEVVRAAGGSFAVGQATEARLAARVRRRHRRVGNYETVNIRGRRINIRERPTADGGIVGIYSDATVRQSQQARAQELSVYKTQIPQLAGATNLSEAFVAEGSRLSPVDVQFEADVGRTRAPNGPSLRLISQNDEPVALVPDAGGHACGPTGNDEPPVRYGKLETSDAPRSLNPAALSVVHDAPGLATTELPDVNEDQISRRISAIASEAFPNLDPRELQAITTVCTWFSIPGGSRLLMQGEESDAIYVVASGILGAYRADAAGEERLLGRIGVGELIGEMGFLTGDPRTATIRALRNSELIKIARADLPELAFQHPGVLTELCRTVIFRLRDVQERGQAALNAKTFCLIAEDEQVDVRSFADYMTNAVGSNPLVLTKSDAVGNTAEWFFRHERDHSVVIYIAEPELTAWTKFCLRQSDQVVLLVRGNSRPRPIPMNGSGQPIVPLDIPSDLVLLWDGAIGSSQTTAWLDVTKPRLHHHVRSRADGERAARLVTGKGTGLVLSGGGARGLAHVGVAKALAELGIHIDAIGGASMGALVGAGLALEWDLDPMFTNCMQGFLSRPYLRDLGLSRSALFSGRKISRLFNEWFGEVCIEETPVNFFCVSTNLSAGSLSVHTSGKIADWVRASAAIPGVFPPILNQGSVHVDGGVLDNLPISTMRSGVSSVVAVNVGLDEPISASDGPPGVLELLKRVATIGSDAKLASGLRNCDHLVRPDVGHIGLLDWRSHREAIEAGYKPP